MRPSSGFSTTTSVFVEVLVKELSHLKGIIAEHRTQVCTVVAPLTYFETAQTFGTLFAVSCAVGVVFKFLRQWRLYWFSPVSVLHILKEIRSVLREATDIVLLYVISNWSSCIFICIFPLFFLHSSSSRLAVCSIYCFSLPVLHIPLFILCFVHFVSLLNLSTVLR